MLPWIHGPRVYVEVGIDLHCGDRVAPVLEDTPDGCSGDPFAKSTHHPPCNKNILQRKLPAGCTLLS